MMHDNERAYFLHLCECAANEREPARLLQLIREINDLAAKDRSGDHGPAETAGGPSARGSADIRHLLGQTESSGLAADSSRSLSESRSR